MVSQPQLRLCQNVTNEVAKSKGVNSLKAEIDFERS